MNKYIGADVTSLVTLPVIIFEPMTMLQKMVEVCAFIWMLNRGLVLSWNGVFSIFLAPLAAFIKWLTARFNVHCATYYKANADTICYLSIKA